MPEMDYSKFSPFNLREGRFLNYDTKHNVFNLQPKHLRKTRAALARVKAGTGAFRISTMGDSTVAGFGLADSGTDTWPVQLVKKLALNGYPINGTGIVPAHINLSNNPQWTYPGDWIGHASWSSIRRNTTTTGPLAFTSGVAGTIARVYYSAGSAAFNLTIDGGAPLLITPPGGSNIMYTEVTGLANTSHVLSIAKTVAGSTLYIFACEVRSSASVGISLYNAGVSGIKTANIYQQNLSHLNFALAESPSDLVIVRCQTNDANISTNAQYRTAMLDVINAVRAAGADLIFMTAVPSLGKDFTETTRILYEMAEEFDYPLIDEQQRFGTYAEMNASGLMFDDFHPTKQGYLDEVESVYNALFA